MRDLDDHSSIPATIEAVFGLNALTARDAQANKLSDLATLAAPRDTPAVLPNPASPAPTRMAMPSLVAEPPPVNAIPVTRPKDKANDGSLPVFLHSAVRQDLQVSPENKKHEILARVKAIKTREQAMEYLQEEEGARAENGAPESVRDITLEAQPNSRVAPADHVLRIQCRLDFIGIGDPLELSGGWIA